MERKTLTTVGIKAIRPAAKRQEIRDGGARRPLFDRPADRATSRSRCASGSRTARPTKLVLGPVDFSSEAEGEPVIGQPLTLAAARRLAADVGRERARGKDVVADRKVAKGAEEVRAVASAARTASVRPRATSSRTTPSRRPGDWQGTARLFGLDRRRRGGQGRPRGPVGGAARRRRSTATTSTSSSRRPGQRGTPVGRTGPTDLRSRGRATCSPPCRRCSRGSTATAASRSTRAPAFTAQSPAASRERVLTDAEIAKFWKAASAEASRSVRCCKLLLLTGCRLNEVAGMRRSEISDDGDDVDHPRIADQEPPASRRAADADGAGARSRRCELATDFVFTTNGTTPVSRLEQGSSAGSTRRWATSAVAPPRPSADRRDRHGRDRDRAAHRRGGAQSHQRSEGGRRGNLQPRALLPRRSRRRWSAGPRTSPGWSPGSRTRSSLSRREEEKCSIDYDDMVEIIDGAALPSQMDWNDGDPQPPWKPDGDKRYVQKMTDWMNCHLDHAPDPRLRSRTIELPDSSGLRTAAPRSRRRARQHRAAAKEASPPRQVSSSPQARPRRAPPQPALERQRPSKASRAPGRGDQGSLAASTTGRRCAGSCRRRWRSRRPIGRRGRRRRAVGDASC